MVKLPTFYPPFFDKEIKSLMPNMMLLISLSLGMLDLHCERLELGIPDSTVPPVEASLILRIRPFETRGSLDHSVQLQVLISQ